jgi:hypothetical protein
MSTPTRERDRRSDRPQLRANAWHPGRFRRGLPPELGEWLAFAVLAEEDAEAPLRSLLTSYEMFAACEGHPAIPEIAFVRHLETLGLRRRGATFLGVKVFTAVPALRLLTRLELYGFRFRVRDGELAWRGPDAIADLEKRVIARHRRDLVAALHQIEESKEALRAHRATALPAPTRVTRLSSRRAA